MRLGSIGGAILLIWLLIGAFAGFQRGYYSDEGDASCAKAGTILVTIVAGPLNYLGVDPEVDCSVPQPTENN
ncbi:hypothetical protein [Spirilliplanes yamanashiensis]|uniref:Uncharacterized protein n=1 Tax=Spirilliplanes yamanashiensis TaxID=42233 RepID=A0A8J4DLK5_9ACTN|nr:hypothetical protein [Spirilliplanes yamanashiensis]MDP9818885.1 hypothetical protein [Spirilliplanes yamanashiensis]GIJ05339.1 hypothetical protein Sya03_46910 [Spirilliplanes yamanashiensis]